jgi:ABC-type transporter Mla subunit MlaD
VDHSEKLRQTLSELHAELKSAGAVDPATRQLLQDALADIQRSLAAAETVPAEERPTADDGIAERLQTASAKFEATHPTLAGLIERLTDLLSAAGI